MVAILSNSFVRFFLFISLVSACKTDNVQKDTITSFVQEYLHDNYVDTYNVLKFRESTAPGQQTPTYEVKLASEKYPQRNFYMIVQGNDPLKITSDGYPNVLIQEAFAEKLQGNISSDYIHTVAVQAAFIPDDSVAKIKDLKSASTNLGELQDSKWFSSIQIVVADIESQRADINEVLAKFATKINDVVASEHIVVAYLYQDDSLTEDDLQMDMTKDRFNRIPHEDKVVEEWEFGWTAKSLEKVNGDFSKILESKDVIPY